IPTQLTCPQRKGGVLRTQSAGGLRPTVSLGLCIALGVAPLLLLATPGRASPRSTGARPYAAGATASSRHVARGVVAPMPSSWTVPIALAPDRAPTTTTSTSTTTTTTAPAIVASPAAVVRQVSAVPPPPPTTTTTTTTTT